MSDVEKFYAAVAAKFGCTRPWAELHPVEQYSFVQGINMILEVFREV